MSRTPATNVMVDPARFGLTLVNKFFGEFRPEPRDLVVVSGDMVQDSAGRVSIFVGLTANREPVLVDTICDFEVLHKALEKSRLHVET